MSKAKMAARAWLLVAALIAVVTAGCAAVTETALKEERDLAGKRPEEPQYYTLETRLVSFAEDGTRTPGNVYRLHLAYVPAGEAAGKAGRYVCRKFTLQRGTGPAVRIPALDGWSYVPYPGTDDKGQVFGIELARFTNLVDANGTAIPPDVCYHVYNTFIDFHGFCNVFAEPTSEGKGVQDLKTIGQKIVHESANSEAPVNLPGFSEPGSKFKNGEVTLEFKGLSIVDGAPCALLGFDSGDSSFVVLIKPTPEMKIEAVGASHYKGDIYLDLATRWARKVEMTEVVVSQVTAGEQKLANAVIERTSTIRAVSKQEFEKD